MWHSEPQDTDQNFSKCWVRIRTYIRYQVVNTDPQTWYQVPAPLTTSVNKNSFFSAAPEVEYDRNTMSSLFTTDLDFHMGPRRQGDIEVVDQW